MELMKLTGHTRQSAIEKFSALPEKAVFRDDFNGSQKVFTWHGEERRQGASCPEAHRYIKLYVTKPHRDAPQ